MTEPTRVLLVDDDAVDRASVQRALRLSGLPHEVVESSSGAEGLAQAQGRSFDCVLLDYRLPDVDTEELLTALVSPEGGGQAVVMLTGESDQMIADRLMRAGALDYLAKSETTPSSLARAIRYAKARRAFLTELDNARRDAEDKSRALDSLNQQKELLLSIIAHDLRNPFQSILALSELLSEAVTARDMSHVERRAKGLHEAASQAYALAESLFGWANAQMNASEIELTEVDLDHAIEKALENCHEAAARKSIQVVRSTSGLRAEAHPDMLAAVLRNLISNAVKFTTPGGEIRLSACSRAGAVEVDVADSGVGMNQETLENLFRLESRKTTTGTAGERGGGLGLLLCHDLVERQGGSIRALSEPGRGAIFSVRLRSAGGGSPSEAAFS